MKKTEYAIETVRGHILINDDRGSRVLVDTGSPLSFHAGGVIALGGSSFTVPASLMGMEVLSRTPVLIAGGQVWVWTSEAH